MITPDDLLRDLLQTFQAEASEHLQTLNLALLSLEANPDEPRRKALVQEAFRAAHSLKGAARAVSLDQIEKLAHAMESLLQEVRDVGRHLEPTAYDTLYDALDAIGHLLEGETVAIEQLLTRLNQSSESGPQAVVQAPLAAEIAAPAGEPPLVEASSVAEAAAIPLDSSSDKTIRVAIPKVDNLMAQVGELLVSTMNAEQRTADMKAIRQEFARWPKVWREIELLLPKVKDEAGRQLVEILTHYKEQFQETTQEVNRLDQQLRQDTLHLRMIASQLDDSVRHVRMVPFETLVPVLQRAVRDAAHLEAKQITFHVTGSEVELDKRVLEALKDPFIHLLRNAVSHGIENPEVRMKLGKSVEGCVMLSVQQRGAEVRISVGDDGAGFDLNGLRQAGNGKNGNALQEQASSEEIIELAFQSGVTTKHGVTELSGRGIGLDVVRKQLEALQGRIEVESVPGKGSAIHLVVPITLTISRGLLVQIGEERYVLPMLSVEKIVQPRQTFSVEGRTMLTVDGITLPLVSLADLLDRPVTNPGRKNRLAVIMAVAEQRLALLVDDVLTEQELAVKPLGRPLHRVPNVAGAALTSDGKPVVILNAADLIKSAKGIRRHTEIQIREPVAPKMTARVLVVDDSITTRTLEKHILETAGYQITTAIDGKEALRRLGEHHFDLVVSDVEMPNMDGIALTRYLRGTREYENTPLILVTSLESQEDRERGMVAGANAYIVKRGLDPTELLKTIHQLISIEEV